MAEIADRAPQQSDSPPIFPQFDLTQGFSTKADVFSQNKSDGGCEGGVCHLPKVQIVDGAGEKGAGKSAEAKTGDAKSTEAKTGDGKSADAKIGDTKSADAKSADTKSADDKAADAKSADAKAEAGAENVDTRLYGGHTRKDLADIVSARHDMSEKLHKSGPVVVADTAGLVPRDKSVGAHDNRQVAKVADKPTPEKTTPEKQPEAKRVFSEAEMKEAIKTAADQHKPVIIRVTAGWCGPCQSMHKSWDDAKVQKQVGDGAIVVDVDYDRSNVARTLGVQSLPTTMILRPNEQGTVSPNMVVDKGVGYMSADGLSTFLKRNGVNSR